MKRLTFLVLPLLLGVVACSSPADESTGETGESEQALQGCGRTRYNQALEHYKRAVAWSKDRNQNGVCESDNGFMWSIADEASRAVSKCSEFRTVLRESPWAAPVRTALADSLTLHSLTGELLVIKDSAHQNWSGVEALFSQRLTFWARAEGAYGPRVRIEFGPNGTATWRELVMDEATGDISLEAETATYTMTKATSSNKSKRTVTVVHGGKTETFSLRVESQAEYSAAPMFVLEPASDSEAPKLFSLVSECDA